MALPTLGDDIDPHIDAFLAQNPRIDPLDAQSYARELFMAMSSPQDIPRYNARRAFLELIAVPNEEDIEEWAFNQCAPRWRVGENGMYYHKDRK